MICIKFIYTRSYARVGVGKLTTPPKVDYFFGKHNRKGQTLTNEQKRKQKPKKEPKYKN